MRILLTNDDGIHAEGLAVLERIARTISDDVWVVAPETDQSGLAHSLTLSEPLRLRKIDERHFALRGTPTDCVIMGVREVLPEPPDLILSGVNSGQNVADDVTYSGTVAGAMEGTLLGIRSIAVSQAYNWNNGRVVPWETCEELAPALLKKLIALEPAGRRVSQCQFSELPAFRSRRHHRHGAGQAGAWPVHRRAAGRARLSLLLAALRARRGRAGGRHRSARVARPADFGHAAKA